MKIEDEVSKRFRFLATPRDVPPQEMSVVNQARKRLHSKSETLALLCVQLCPESRERAIALTSLEEFLLFADRCIMQNGIREPEVGA